MQQFLQSQELQRHQLFYDRLDSQSTPPLPPAPQPTKKRSYFPSNPSSVDQTHEYASLQDKMGDAPNLQHHRPTTSSRLGLRSSGGEIVEVQGGHIVRSIGRKDRHSKVCTAKGPRDRRVRLSAHTAIQFYDVQDRLGYDRPSKAVDWLIKKAKTAIDELDEFPVWNPTSGSIGNSNMEQEDPASHHKQQEETTTRRPQQGQHLAVGDAIAGPSSKRPISMLGNEKSFQVQQLQNNSNNPVGSSSQSFLPSSLDSDAIDDTIKTFFPMGGSGESSSSAMQFQSFPNPELLSRTSSHSQDLRLSLQSFQDPMLLHHHNPQTQHHQNTTNQTGQSQSQAHAIFSGTAAMGFDLSGWSENQPSAADIGRFQRIAAWYASGDTTAALGGGGGAFMFNPPPLFGQSHLFSQRGPLQSSNTPSVRARMDTAAAAVTIAAAGTDSYQLQHHHHQTIPIHPSSFAGIGFASGVGGFSCFQIPARIQGEEEEHDGISVKPSSASSDSHH